MITYTTTHRVRYAETDKMGYMYYGHYAKLYEIGRVEMLRDLGVPYTKFEDQENIMLPVLSVESKFLKPAYYDELLTIESTLRELPSKMITVFVRILNEIGDVLHKAVVKLFFINMKTQKRISAPDFFIEALKTKVQ